MNLSILSLQFIVFFAMFDFQQTSDIPRVPYMNKLDEHRVLVHLEDYVSPEFVEYYFDRFGYLIETMNIAPVQGITTKPISEQELKRISAHPFVQDIQMERVHFVSPFLGANVYDNQLIQKKITFSYYVTDEMIEAFLFQNQKLDIKLLPRSPKSVLLKPTKIPTRLMAELDMLIYVKETKEVID
ncbi:MAG: hypothetical protein ACMZ7B_06490 [Balneola sp.]